MSDNRRPNEKQKLTLTKRQQQALELTINGASMRHISEVVGVSLRPFTGGRSFGVGMPAGARDPVHGG